LVRLLLYIKHHLGFLWQLLERTNAILFSILYSKKLDTICNRVLQDFSLTGYVFRVLTGKDIPELERLITSQGNERLNYFNPHGFDEASLLKVSRNPAFLMMGVFEGPQLVGYFFLRFFWNRKCFVGRLIDEPYEGKGIGRVMNNIMYNIGWRMGFRVMSTISKNNRLVMRSHANNHTMVVLKELADDYLLVEFVEKSEE
jgi:hypothetical protein